MKLLKVTLIVFITISCAVNDTILSSDYNYEGRFSGYTSFGLINGDFLGDNHDRRVVEKYIKNIFGSWGYTSDSIKPQLLVYYTIYYDDLNLKGSNQPPFRTWLNSSYSNKKKRFPGSGYADMKGNISTRTNEKVLVENYDRINYHLKGGTLIISFVDRMRNETVWQGYASGICGLNRHTNERMLRSAVTRIMDEYRLLAFK